MNLCRAEWFLPPKDLARLGRRDFDFVRAGGAGTRQNRGNWWGLECTHAKRSTHKSCERAASSVMNHAIHFQFCYFAGIDDGGTRMIHQGIGLIIEDENEKIAAGEGDVPALILNLRSAD